MEPFRELAGLVFGGRADEDVSVTPDHTVAFRLQVAGERLRLLGGSRLEPDLPWREPLLEDVLLRLEFLRRLVVPPILLSQPVLDRADAALGAELAELRFDDRPSALGLGPRACIDEERVVVARDDEAPALELLGQLSGLEAEIEAEPLEQALGISFPRARP